MLISRLAITLAIAQEEGWFDPIPTSGTVHTGPDGLPTYRNRPQRNNNPGNLRWAADRFPQSGMEGKPEDQYVVFPTHLSGWAALENDIYAKILKIDPDTRQGWNLVKLLKVYCPAGDGKNDPVHYAKDVAKRIKTDALVPLKTLVLEEGKILRPWISGPLAGPPKPDWDDIVGWAIKAGIHR